MRAKCSTACTTAPPGIEGAQQEVFATIVVAEQSENGIERIAFVNGTGRAFMVLLTDSTLRSQAGQYGNHRRSTREPFAP
jgi:hypothetical protein